MQAGEWNTNLHESTLIQNALLAQIRVDSRRSVFQNSSVNINFETALAQ